ncbi:hypothetical protein BJ165DRAFT_1389153 [Panaeolus papilionaceus]|nr:hypothetical protein BJ165DRAFT_1389153 [Panaeolus papilionaceus]
MSVYSREQHYVLPARVVYTGVLALLISLSFNALGTVFYTFSAIKTTENYRFSDGTPAQAPISPDIVALEVVDSERYGMHDDNDWNSVTPLGHGFVKVGDKGDFYAISMYHQLHCMNGFRKMLGGQQHRNASRHEHDEAHILHCLSYMRQMVLCAGDTTLEPAFIARNTDGRKTTAAYGSGVTHQCKDWVQIRDWAENNYQGWKDEAKDFAASEANTVHSD